MSLSFKGRVEVIYRYIVQGISVNDIDDGMGLDNGTASKIIRECGFNKIKTGGWQKGQHNGMYRPGSAACKGIRVDRDIIADYLDDIEGWDGDFEWYISELAKELAYERQQQRAAEESRRKQEEIRRQREAQAAAAIEEAKRLRALEEQNRLIAQQNAAKEYSRLIELGKSYLKNNNTQEAYNCFRKARELSETVETAYYMAKILAESGNASEHGSLIIELMRQYQNYLEQNGKNFNAQEHIWYAEACLAVGFKSDACNQFYYAGDIYYDEKNYEKAAQIYLDANHRTGYWSSYSVCAPFRMAYAISQKKNLPKEDVERCIFWYDVAIKNNINKKYSLGNISYMYYLAGRYDEGVKAAQSAISMGLREKYVYGNLLLSQMGNQQYDEALETMETMDSLGFSYSLRFKADALYFSENHENSEAITYYAEYLNSQPYDEECIFNYLLCSGDRNSVEKALVYLESGKKGRLFSNIAGLACLKAEMLDDNPIYMRTLKFCPDKMEKYLREKEQQRIAEEARRREREKQLEVQRLEEEARRREQAEKLRIEQEKQLEQQRLEALRKKAAEKQRREEELLILM